MDLNHELHNNNTTTTTPQSPILQHTTTTPQQSVIQQQHITDCNTTTIKHHNNNTDAPTTSTSFKYPIERGYTVTMTEEQCLEKGKWLNDAIINVTLSWIHHEVLSPEWSSIIRILDSVWYVSATRDYPAGGTDALVKNMERMRKWFPAGHPFDGRVTIIPICQQNHWFAIVAINVNDGWLVTSLDSLDTQTSRTAQITVLELVKMCWPQTRFGLISCKVPRQQNFTDCGLHVIRNVAKIAIWIPNNPDSTWDALEDFLNETPEPVSRDTLKALIQCMKTGTKNTELQTKIIGWINKAVTEEKRAEEGTVDMKIEETPKEDAAAYDEEVEEMKVDIEETPKEDAAVEGMKVDEELELSIVDETPREDAAAYDALLDDLYVSDSESESSKSFIVQGHSHQIREDIRWVNKSSTAWEVLVTQEEIMKKNISNAAKDLKGKRQLKMKRKVGNVTVQVRIYHRHATVIKT